MIDFSDRIQFFGYSGKGIPDHKPGRYRLGTSISKEGVAVSDNAYKTKDLVAKVWTSTCFHSGQNFRLPVK